MSRRWTRFFFEPRSPLPIAVYRILYGLFLFLYAIALYPELSDWFGDDGLHPPAHGFSINLFRYFSSPAALKLLWITFLIASLALAMGCATRVASIVCFLVLLSIRHENNLILNGADTIPRVMGFFLMFSNAGGALSVDAWLNKARGVPNAVAIDWAEPMMRLQFSWIYLCTFLWKIQSRGWLDGTMGYYVLHLEPLKHHSLPVLGESPVFSQLATWGTMAVELSLASLIWYRPLRYYVLAAGVVLHLTMAFFLNIPFFQLAVLTTYVLFIDPKHLERLVRTIGAVVRTITGRETVESVPAGAAPPSLSSAARARPTSRSEIP